MSLFGNGSLIRGIVSLKVLNAVLHEAHKRQVEETMNTLSEGPEGFYKSLLD